MTTETALPSPALKPWLSIWFQPRATLRQLRGHYSGKFVWAVLLLSALNESLAPGSDDMDNPLLWLPVWLLVGVALFFGFCALQHYIGHKLGGSASPQDVRSANALSYIPVLGSLPPLLIALALFGGQLYASPEPGTGLDIVQTGLELLYWGLFLWSCITITLCLSEAFGFSLWRALACWLLPLLGLIVLMIAGMTAFVMLTGWEGTYEMLCTVIECDVEIPAE